MDFIIPPNNLILKGVYRRRKCIKDIYPEQEKSYEKVDGLWHVLMKDGTEHVGETQCQIAKKIGINSKPISDVYTGKIETTKGIVKVWRT